MRRTFVPDTQAARRNTWRRGTLGRLTAVGLVAAALAVTAVITWALRPTAQSDGDPEASAKVRVDHHSGTQQAKDAAAPSGRHDRIQHDFFTYDSGPGQPQAADANQRESGGGRPTPAPQRETVNEGPRLKAIMLGSQPRALINDVIVAVGEKVRLNAGGSNDDEFEVTAIDDRQVQLKRGGQVVVLRLESEDDGQSGGARSPSER
jgi:hypothetical protein